MPPVFNSRILQLYLFSVYPTCTDSNKLREFHGLSRNSKKSWSHSGQYVLVPHTRRKDVCGFCFILHLVLAYYNPFAYTKTFHLFPLNEPSNNTNKDSKICVTFKPFSFLFWEHLLSLLRIIPLWFFHSNTTMTERL